MHLAAPRLIKRDAHRHGALLRLACEHLRAVWVGDVYDSSAGRVYPKDTQSAGVALRRDGDIDTLAPQRKIVGDIDIVRLVDVRDQLKQASVQVEHANRPAGRAGFVRAQNQAQAGITGMNPDGRVVGIVGQRRSAYDRTHFQRLGTEQNPHGVIVCSR